MLAITLKSNPCHQMPMVHSPVKYQLYFDHEQCLVLMLMLNETKDRTESQPPLL